jgi:hypothetical protein
MKRKYWLLLLVFAVLLNGSSVLADSDFYVVAGGGPSVGTKITSLPQYFTIQNPGFYFLGCNLTYSYGGIAIDIQSDNVTIDLMGFTLRGTGWVDLSTGISMNGSVNVEIRNGTIENFGNGIKEFSGGGRDHRVINIRARYNKKTGINLSGKGHLVQNCNSSNNGENGIWIESGRIKGCETNFNGLTGITLNGPGNVISNTVACNSDQIGVLLSTSTGDPILMDQNTVSGDGTHYSGGNSATVWAGRSAAYFYGNNAGAPIPGP